MKSYYIDVYTWKPSNQKESSAVEAVEALNRVVIRGDNAKKYINGELKRIVEAANAGHPRGKELRLTNMFRHDPRCTMYIEGNDFVARVTLIEIDREILVQ